MPNPPRTSDEIREAFVAFFKERGHLVLPGWPLVPVGDPTSLFTSAGMQQFKPVFLGEQQPPAQRAVTVQRCFRTTDIEEVGDYSHLTCFEMLGNFSFGDYFKQQAIEWAWELLTGVYAIDPSRLHATIYLTDEHAYRYWREVGLPHEQIHRRDEDLNYWFGFPNDTPGASGPCGPDTEIYFDHFPERGPLDHQMPLDECARRKLGVGYDEDRFLEIWNLVFMELYQAPDGARTPLPQQNIDTGSGLERVAAVLQGKTSVFETDIFLPILQEAAAIAGVDYFGPSCTEQQGYAIRAMSEHTRAATMLIADGVVPSNEGRGYVLRRVIRRGIFYARSIGVAEPFTARLAEAAIEKLRTGHPHVEENRDFIRRALQGEEERFLRTLGAASHRLDGLLDDAAARGQTSVPGDGAFSLYDTYGLPLELTTELASRRGFTVDAEGFELAMDAQRARARQQAKFFQPDASGAFATLEDHSAFVGYSRVDADSRIVAISRDGQLHDLARVGEECEVVLDTTPFYPEGGGQVGDRGNLRGPSGVFTIEDTQATGGAIVHRGRVAEGELRPGDSVEASVDHSWRAGSTRNHTGTHLLHAALRAILGPHVRQQGSLVGPERLRFDFTHLEATDRQALIEVQALANDRIRADLEVAWRNTSYRQAIDAGALAFFGDKYGSEVRVVEIKDDQGVFSAELCGGTHVHHTGQLGFVHIVREQAVAAGTRRIEALTGRGAETFLLQQQEVLARLAHKLSVGTSEVEERIDALQADLERLRKQNEHLERLRTSTITQSLLESVERVGDAQLVVARVDVSSADALRDIADRLRQHLTSSLVVLGAEVDGRPQFLAAATRDLVDRGVHAGNLIRDTAKVAGGGGGGRPDLAQAGARDPGLIPAALEEARRLGRTALAG